VSIAELTKLLARAQADLLLAQTARTPELNASAGIASAVSDEKGGKVNHKNIARSIVSAFRKNDVLKLYAKSIRRC
jgi:hypothetical protein